MNATNPNSDNHFISGDCAKDIIGPIGKQCLLFLVIMAIITFSFTTMFLESRVGTYIVLAICGSVVLCLTWLFPKSLFGWSEELYLKDRTGWEWISPRATALIVISIGLGGDIATHFFGKDFLTSAIWAIGFGIACFFSWLLCLYIFGAKKDYSCAEQAVHEGPPPPQMVHEKPPLSLRGNGGKGI